MTDFANLPADITPGAFFKAVEDALQNEPAPAGAAPDKLLIHITGDAGGTWAMGFEGGRLTIPEGTAANPPLQISMTTDDLRAFVAGSIRDAIKAKAGDRAIDAKQIAKIFGITRKTEQVRAIKGDIQVAITTATGAYKLTMTFGGGAPKVADPTTKITMSFDDFVALTRRELDPMQAFFMGRIQMDGDLNLAMGLAPLMMG